MDKRYQVFLSSTYSDLQEERQEVIQALLELDCIPAGMELFPAANDDQWTLIKKYIDDCDYYIVVVAGRYGSIGPHGQSYTEMEYRYAVGTGKPVIAFLHKTPGSIVADQSESTEEGRTKLAAFRALAQQKMCKFWDSPSDLGSKVSRSLIQLIKAHPTVGWVRADQVGESSAKELLKLRGRIDELEAELRALRLLPPDDAKDFSQGDDLITIRYTVSVQLDKYEVSKKFDRDVSLSWSSIFNSISPFLMEDCSESRFKLALADYIKGACLPTIGKDFKGANAIGALSIDNQDFQTIKVQLRALGLITMSDRGKSVKDKETYWKLTPFGDSAMLKGRAIIRGSSAAETRVDAGKT